MAVTFADTFTDTDGVDLDAHTPDTDTSTNGWTQQDGTAEVQSNRCAQATTGTVSVYATFDGQASDGTYTLDHSCGGSAQVQVGGPVFRWQDVSNHWFVGIRGSDGLCRLFRRQSGTSNEEDSYTIPSFDASTYYTIVVILSGTSISVTINGVTDALTATSSALQTQTTHGVRMGRGEYRIDNLSFDAVAADSVTIGTPADGAFYGIDPDGTYDLAISGSYSGSPTAIEADFNAQGYSTIDASPAGGTFSGTLSGLTKGQGTLTVRFTNDTGVTDTASISIGLVGLMIGQSNVSGRGTNNQSYSHGSLTAYMKREGEAITELSDPTDSGDSTATPTGSFVPIFTTYMMAEADVPLLLITAADGSTGLVDDNDWEKDGVGGTGNGASYDNAVTQVTNSGINRVHFAFWGAGNQDASNAVSQANYNAGLDGLISNLRGEGGALSNVILVAWQMGDTTVADANVNAIRAATAEAWGDNANIYPGPVLFDVDLGDGSGDGLHFKTDAELTTLAERAWACVSYALDDVFTGGSLFDGVAKVPEFVSAVENGARTQVTVTFDTTLRTGTTLATAAWVVKDDGTPVTIDSASVSGSAVVLTLNAALTGSTTTVTLGDGDNAVGLVVPEGAAIALPTTGSMYHPCESFADQTVDLAGVSIPIAMYHYRHHLMGV